MCCNEMFLVAQIFADSNNRHRLSTQNYIPWQLAGRSPSGKRYNIIKTSDATMMADFNSDDRTSVQQYTCAVASNENKSTQRAPNRKSCRVNILYTFYIRFNCWTIMQHCYTTTICGNEWVFIHLQFLPWMKFKAMIIFASAIIRCENRNLSMVSYGVFSPIIISR